MLADGVWVSECRPGNGGMGDWVKVMADAVTRDGIYL